MSDAIKSIVDSIEARIRQGDSVNDISNDFGVSPSIVEHIKHTISKNGIGATNLKRLHELQTMNVQLDSGSSVIRDYSVKQLAKGMIQAGMQPGQIHISTGLSIHKVRHLFQQVCTNYEVAESALPMPTTLASRIVMSIFATHYKYMCELSGSNSVQISNVLIAWSRTADDVFNSCIPEMDGFESKLVSLGSLFEVARMLREVQSQRRFEWGICPKCGSLYVYFTTGRRVRPSGCCFCQLLELGEKGYIASSKRS